MNKKELIKHIKKDLCKDAIFNIEIIHKNVYFNLYSFGNREVCNIKIPYISRLDKSNIYKAILTLVTNFDFSFRVCFDNTKDIYNFIK